MPKRRSNSIADELKDQVVAALEDAKARDISVLDVRGITAITDIMVIASGTSDRHVKSAAQNVVEEAKKAGTAALGVEGEDVGEWVLIDLGDVIVHVMLPRVRDFYNLEKLWSVSEEVTAKRPRSTGVKRQT